jgi:RNA polymerase sigma factor (sigma-70 family)
MAVTEASHAASRALDDLYRRHGADVYRYALAVLGNHADAEDVTQTTFLNAYRALEQGVHPRKPQNWLLTIASNSIKQRFRREQARPREVELDRDVATDGHEDDGPSVGELLTALSRIPPQQRQAIVLREFEGRSYKEIAEILGVTTSALETLLFRARRSLTDELAHQLTCTEAQQAISRAADRRLGRKDKRRLNEHLAECPDCAQFARLQQQHSKALRGLALVPIPLSLTLFKGLEGSAAAATLPVTAGAAAAGTGAAGVGAGMGGSAATAGGGLFAGGLVVKAAAVVAAAGVAGGVTVAGVKEIGVGKGKSAPPAASTSHGKSHVLHSQRAQHASAAGLAHGKAIARGQTGDAPPGALKRHKGTQHTPSRGRSSSQRSSHPNRGQSSTKDSHPAKSTTTDTKQQPTPNGRATVHSNDSTAQSPSAETTSTSTQTTTSQNGHGASSNHSSQQK